MGAYSLWISIYQLSNTITVACMRHEVQGHHAVIIKRLEYWTHIAMFSIVTSLIFVAVVKGNKSTLFTCYPEQSFPRAELYQPFHTILPLISHFLLFLIFFWGGGWGGSKITHCVERLGVYIWTHTVCCKLFLSQKMRHRTYFYTIRNVFFTAKMPNSCHLKISLVHFS